MHHKDLLGTTEVFQTKLFDAIFFCYSVSYLIGGYKVKNGLDECKEVWLLSTPNCSWKSVISWSPNDQWVKCFHPDQICGTSLKLFLQKMLTSSVHFVSSLEQSNPATTAHLEKYNRQSRRTKMSRNPREVPLRSVEGDCRYSAGGSSPLTARWSDGDDPPTRLTPLIPVNDG